MVLLDGKNARSETLVRKKKYRNDKHAEMLGNALN